LILGNSRPGTRILIAFGSPQIVSSRSRESPSFASFPKSPVASLAGSRRDLRIYLLAECSTQGTLAQLDGYYRWHAQFYDATRWAFLFGRRTDSLGRTDAPAATNLRVLAGPGDEQTWTCLFFPDAQIVGLTFPDMLARPARKSGRA